MDQGDFARSSAVQDFLGWMRDLPSLDWDAQGAMVNQSLNEPFPEQRVALAAMPRIMVRLNIPSSRFVPGGLKAYAPLGALSLLYAWQAPGLVVGDFIYTAQHLERLSERLRWAIASNDRAETLAVCSEILRWGGERNMNHGARPFLEELEDDLPAYLARCARLLDLQRAVISPTGELQGLRAMNSMLSKIYALTATDGLPIYDSRVAGAIATVVETWRRCMGLRGSLPAELAFPSIPPNRARTARARFAGCETAGQLVYGGTSQTGRWAAAQVRLGWLLKLMLGHMANPQVMRAMEAALFMAGYDCSGIAQPLPGVGKVTLHVQRRA